MDLVATLSDPKKAQALVTWNINIAASNPDQARLHHALRDERLFHVAVDPFPTDTPTSPTMCLPAASFLEFDDIVSPVLPPVDVGAGEGAGADGRRAAQPGDLPPPGRKPWVTTSLNCSRMTDVALDEVCRQMGLTDFCTLAAKGTIDIWPEPVLQFADLAVPTPSGKVEIASGAAEADGHPRLPQPIADPRPQGNLFRLLSPGIVWLMNSSYNEDRKSRTSLAPRR
jgi:hypothetical protein